MLVIEVRDLRKGFGPVTAVDGLSFSLERGEFYGLLGPNGAGKTSTIRMLYGISPLGGGSLKVFGLDIAAHWREIRTRTGVCQQDNTLDPDLSVEQNLFVYAGYFGLERSLAKARTFGFVREVEYLRSKGLALGGSLDNAVVLDEDGVINADGLRFKDEFVRHKILDFIGDTAVLEAPLKGRFEVFASGHGLNNAFVRKLWSESGRCLERVVPGAGQAPSRRPHLSEPLAQPAAAVA